MGYNARLALTVAFSASVAGGLGDLLPNMLPPPPLEPAKGSPWVA